MIFPNFLRSLALNRFATRKKTRIYQSITNNHTSFYLWCKENLLNHWKASNIVNMLVDLVFQVLLAQMTLAHLHKLCKICYVDKRILLMMPSRLSCDLSTIYRPDTKKQNEDQTWCLNFCMHNWVSNFSDMLVWPYNFINDVIMTVTWPCYILKTRHKIRTRFGISCSTFIVDLKPCQICHVDERNSSTAPLWLSRDLASIYRRTQNKDQIWYFKLEGCFRPNYLGIKYIY